MARPVSNALALDGQQQAALAAALGVRPDTVSGWLTRGRANRVHAYAIHSWLVEQGLDEGRTARDVAELLGAV